MSSAQLAGNAAGTGSMVVQAPPTNSNQVATIPDRTGNIAMDGPAFRATNSTTQSVSTGTLTKIVFNTETFDTNNCFDSTTNYRFTPTVAGYYQINSVISASGVNTSWARGWIYKNGSAYSFASIQATTSGAGYGLQISDVVYCNGSTDYVEIYVTLGTGDSLNTIFTSFFSGVMVRAA